MSPDKPPYQSATFLIRRIEPAGADALFRLRREALVEEPFAFLASPEDELASSPDVLRKQLSSWSDTSAVIGAFDGDDPIGMVGVARDRHIKAAHRACIWGVYVNAEFRGLGLASRLIEAALDFARSMDGVETVYLSVSERTPNAKRLYESAGFTVWGFEPDCIRHNGESASEYHLSRAL